MARVVLIGAKGFVGSNIARRLGAGTVRADLPETDITEPESLSGLLCAGDIVVNASGYANATDCTENGKALFQSVNVGGLRNLAVACSQAGVAQLVHISSVAAMGRWHREGVTEEMMQPVGSPYAQSKLDGEKLLEEFSNRVPVTILRPTSVFGEGRGLAATLCSFVRKGLVPLPGGGRAKIPFTYIGNVCEAVGLAVGCQKCFGRTFIVGDEESYPLREVVKALAKCMGREARIVPIPVSIARLATRGFEAIAAARGTTPLLDRGRLDTMANSVSYSITAFREATGYAPPFTMQEAAKRIAHWYLGEVRQ